MTYQRGELRTERLSLRRWCDEDRPAFRAMNADPVVMATIGPPMSADAADHLLERINLSFDERGYGLWCVECDGAVVGWTGLHIHAFRPADVEIGWRLQSRYWGNGYATEAAQAVVADAFNHLGLDELISITAATNTRSRAVMERLGMQRNPADDFDHPALDPSNPLRPHVLYRLRSTG